MLKPFNKLKGPIIYLYWASREDRSGPGLKVREYPDGCFVGVIESADGKKLSVVDDEDAILILTNKHFKRCPECQSPSCYQKWIQVEQRFLYRYKGKVHALVLCECRSTSRYFARETPIRYRYDTNYECTGCGSPAIVVKGLYKLTVKKGKEILGDEVRMLKGWKRPAEKEMVVYDCLNCKYDGIMIFLKDQDGVHPAQKFTVTSQKQDYYDPSKHKLEVLKQSYNVKRII